MALKRKRAFRAFGWDLADERKRTLALFQGEDLQKMLAEQKTEGLDPYSREGMAALAAETAKDVEALGKRLTAAQAKCVVFWGEPRGSKKERVRRKLRRMLHPELVAVEAGQWPPQAAHKSEVLKYSGVNGVTGRY